MFVNFENINDIGDYRDQFPDVRGIHFAKYSQIQKRRPKKGRQLDDKTNFPFFKKDLIIYSLFFFRSSVSEEITSRWTIQYLIYSLMLGDVSFLSLHLLSCLVSLSHPHRRTKIKVFENTPNKETHRERNNNKRTITGRVKSKQLLLSFEFRAYTILYRLFAHATHLRTSQVQ